MQQMKWIFIVFILWIGQQAIAQMSVKNQAQNLINPFEGLPSAQAIYSYLKNGGHINKRGYNDESFLHVAAYLNDIPLATFLLEHRRSADLVDKDGWTPLHVAAYMNHQDFADFLLQHGANINEKDFVGQTPLHVATYREHADFVAFLIQQNASVNEVDKMDESSLFLAASTGNKSIALMLLDAGANIHLRENIHNLTHLHAAVRGGNKEIVSLFLERGADPNAVDHFGRTSLVLALSTMRIEIATILAKQENVNIHTPGINNIRPIDLAAFIGDIDLISTLLDRKALSDPSLFQASQGTSSNMLFQEVIFSSLSWALYGYNPIESFSLIQQAINNHSFLVLANQTWQSWMNWILYEGYADLIQTRAMYENIEYLTDQVRTIHQETGQTYLHSALYRRPDLLFIEHELKDPKEQINFLMEAGFDIRFIDNDSRTPFHWALYGADPELRSFFKEKYYDPIIESIISKEKAQMKNTCENALS